MLLIGTLCRIRSQCSFIWRTLNTLLIIIKTHLFRTLLFRRLISTTPYYYLNNLFKSKTENSLEKTAFSVLCQVSSVLFFGNYKRKIEKIVKIVQNHFVFVFNECATLIGKEKDFSGISSMVEWELIKSFLVLNN